MLAVDGVPDEFVAEAAKRYIQGRVLRKSHTFLPTAPEFAIEARKCWTEAQVAAAPPKAIEPPTPSANEGLTPEEVEQRKAQVDALNASLAKRAPDPAPQRHVLTLDDDLAMSRDTPIPVSDHFRKFLQQQISEEAEARQNRAYSASQNGRAA